jgi:hypothetical protein
MPGQLLWRGEWGEMDFGKHLRYFSRMQKRHSAFQGYSSNFRKLAQVCLDNFRPVTEPLALISQIQRSGGSLLSQLLDGHPQIHAHPHELKIGHPKKNNWPSIELSDRPERWFNILFEESTIRLFEEGYKKERASDITFPFIFLPFLQKQIFLAYLKGIESCALRDVFNAYMTSYFGAWLNNQNYYGTKKVVTGFTPRVSDDVCNMERFFSIYPDGRLISIIRNPKNWFPSAFRHNAKIKKDKYGDIRLAIEQWRRSAQGIVRNKSCYAERVCIIRFEDLIRSTGPVMRSLAEFLQVEFDEILLVPTFNRCPIQANTSFENREFGIIQGTLSRHQTLSGKENDIIEEMTGGIYREVLAYALAL